MFMHPLFWPMQVCTFWMNMWMQASQGAGLPPAAAGMPDVGPAAAVALDPVGPGEIGSSATDFR